jgi:hypothetical protein
MRVQSNLPAGNCGAMEILLVLGAIVAAMTLPLLAIAASTTPQRR